MDLSSQIEASVIVNGILNGLNVLGVSVSVYVDICTKYVWCVLCACFLFMYYLA